MTTKRVSLDLVPGAFQFIPKRRNHSENVGTISFISQPFHFGTIANLRTIPKISEPFRISELFGNFTTITKLRTIVNTRNFFTNGGP